MMNFHPDRKGQVPTLRDHSFTDSEIIQQVLQGQTESFSGLVRRYQQNAFRMSVSILQNRADAEDAVAEAFVKAYGALPGCRADTNFKSWFLKITYNCCQDILRKRKKVILQSDWIDLAQRESPHNPLQDMVNEEEKREVWAALSRLSVEDRTAVVMKYYQDASYQEISEALNWPSGTVASRLYRAREKMKNTLQGGVMNG